VILSKQLECYAKREYNSCEKPQALGCEVEGDFVTKREMTLEDRYRQAYMKGYRQGRIEASRETLIHALKRSGKEQGLAPSPSLMQKINRETDYGFLWKMLFVLLENEMSMSEIELHHDKIFRTQDEIRHEKYVIYE
jgi:hypothetical protein